MYKRFLNNEDYKGIITEEALKQITRGNDDWFSQAEEAAEESMLEYLSENYEIEREFMVGKNIMEYNPNITYPPGAHFYYNGKIMEAIRSINGVKRPITKEYWEELPLYDKEVEGEAKRYLQLRDWKPGDVVCFSNKYYRCLEYNGITYNDIRIPGVNAWEKLEVAAWEPNLPYHDWDVVLYEGAFYALLTDENAQWETNPHDSNNWGMIGDYDDKHEFDLLGHDYAVYEGAIYYPVVNPNADELKDSYNITERDPRNGNVKKHMVRLALYELHKRISPNNISSARITDYEYSIGWLKDANRCRINPQIPRKVDEESNKPVTEYAMATFMRDYDPNNNPWQI